jgi:hypothetical protein
MMLIAEHVPIKISVGFMLGQNKKVLFQDNYIWIIN